MYYVYLFKSIPDSANCRVECFPKSFKTLDRAKKTLQDSQGYVIKYPSSKPVYANV